ncbi:hypothetical protein LJC60_05540 [Ruminococcaceae bacterium OttesenSCG-928-D13]|nr:hypothetical protein [Ruminococcaceae bacterium OttesenSCG-928-D13]
MKHEVIARLKALEASLSVGPMMLQVVDGDGNHIECTLQEYLDHVDVWQWERCLSGVTLKGARKVLNSIESAF